MVAEKIALTHEEMDIIKTGLDAIDKEADKIIVSAHRLNEGHTVKSLNTYKRKVDELRIKMLHE